MPYIVVVGYQRFRGPCCLHLQGEPLKRWYPTTTLHDFISQRISRWKVKLSICLHHAMKVYRESGGTDPRILNLGTRWRWVVSFTPRPLCLQRKSHRYPLGMRPGGPQSRSGRGKKSLTLPGIEPGRPAHNLLTMLAEQHSCNKHIINVIEINVKDYLMSTSRSFPMFS